MSNSFHSLDSIRASLGNPPRKLGWFKPSPLEFDEPHWLKKVSASEDPTKEIFGAFKTVWKHGVVAWGRVLRANRAMYEEGSDDCPGTVIFSPVLSDTDAMDLLPKLAARLNELGDAKSPDTKWTQRETEWWEDLSNDMSYHRGFKLPAEWQPPNADVKASSVVFHRAHLPEGKIQSRMLPILVDPVGNIAQIIPVTYWPAGLAAWLVQEHGVEFVSPLQEAMKMIDHLVPEPMDLKDRDEAYQQACGSIVSVSHEVISVPFHIDAYEFNWPAPRDEVLYLSGGMNNAIQPDAGDFPRIELGFYARSKDERFVHLVRSFARYPWETGAALGPWHSVPLGNYGEAMLGSARFTALLFFPGLSKLENPIHEHPAISSSGTRFLTIVPITERELEVKVNQGMEVFIERLKETRFDLAFSADRQELF